MPEGQLHCAVRHTSLRKHFIYRKATSFVYVRFSDNEVDSKLSNEVLASLIMKLCPADINEKSTCRNKSIFGRDGRIRTYECNSQSVVSYRLTTSLYIRKGPISWSLLSVCGVDDRGRTDDLQGHNLAL